MVALPPGITPKTVTVGVASFFDGSLAEGTVTITAPSNVTHTSTKRPLYSSQMSKRFVDGEVSFSLCPTDADGLSNITWRYKANIVISGALVQPDPIYFPLPKAGPDVVDLDGLVAVPSSSGTPISVDVLTTEQLPAQMATAASDPTSPFAAAQRAAAVAAVRASGDFIQTRERAARSPLASVAKAATGPFRILQVGTSIAASAHSPNRVMVQQIKNLFGSSTMSRHQAGYLGGSYLNAVNGWLKQPYSGISYVRLRGSSTSTNLTTRFSGYGDQIVIEWSREPDTAPAGVLVDGVSVGTFGAPGAQQFGMRTAFTVAKGAHTVTISPPASGYSYLEAVEFRDSSRRGVEAIDGAYGGSSLLHAINAQGASGNQTAPLATTVGAGIRALFGRDDIDLIVCSYLVNDAGYNPADVTGADFRQALNAAAVSAKTQGTPIVFIVEPAGHFAIPNDGGSAALHSRYEACKAHLREVADLNEHVFLADWDSATRMVDVAAYAAAYYPTVASLDVAAGTYTGDFIHPDGTLASSSQDVGKVVLAAALGLAAAIPAGKVPLEVELTGYAQTGVSLRPYSTGTDGMFPRRPGALYRVPTATNATPGLNTAIAAAGTADAGGKYLLGVNYNFYALGATIGVQRMLTLRMGPNAAGVIQMLGSDSGLHLYDPDGVEMTPEYAQRQIHLSSLPAGTVVTIAIPIMQDAANKYLTLNGKIYEAAVTDTTVPVLVAAP